MIVRHAQPVIKREIDLIRGKDYREARVQSHRVDFAVSV